MTLQAPDRAPLPLGHVVGYLLGIAGLAFCITLLWLGMRAVMDLGGFCASGGPYEIAVECPDAVIATTPLSIFGGLLAVGLIIWGGSSLEGSWAGLAFLAWPALFLSLGWNFLEYGFFPPDGGWVWSWLFCGVLFVLMGAVPLVVAIAAMREGSGGGRAYASGRVVVRPRPSPPPHPPATAEGRPSPTTVRWSIASSAWPACDAAATSPTRSTRPPRRRPWPKRRHGR